MIIRKDQADAFRQPLAKGFEDRMVQHLRDAFPARVEGLGDDALRAEIRHGVTRAAQYNITAERDVARFIDLMFLVRRDFDTSQETPWARPILTDKASSAENRLRRLQMRARRPGAPARNTAPAFVSARR
jgi:hypothetical protein